jgi:hypothetical protein
MIDLEERGAGWRGIHYGVRDLEAPSQRLRTLGIKPQVIKNARSFVDLPWIERFVLLEEMGLDPRDTGGLSIVLGRFEEHGPPTTTTTDWEGHFARMNSNRISHIGGVVRPENFDSTVARISAVLSTAFYAPYDSEEQGLRYAVSWDSGITIYTPLSTDLSNPFMVDLAERGEGWRDLVCGVRDLEASCARVEALGIEPGKVLGPETTPHAPWIDRFRLFKESRLDPADTAGLRVALAQMEEQL